MTNKPELTDEKIKRRINAIEDRRSASRDFWDGDYEYPEDIELMALRELEELLDWPLYFHTLFIT